LTGAVLAALPAPACPRADAGAAGKKPGTTEESAEAAHVLIPPAAGSEPKKHQAKDEKWAKGRCVKGTHPKGKDQNPKNPRPASAKEPGAKGKPVTPKKGDEELRGTELPKFDTVRLENPQQVPELEFGVLPWEQVVETDVYPYRVHGHLIMTFPNGKTYIGSGTLVGPRHVLTAGHNVYEKKLGGYATEITFVAARNGDDAPYKDIAVRRILTFQEWIKASTDDPDDPSHDHDMAMLILTKDVGDQTGWFGIAQLDNTELKDSSINVTGYPGTVKGEKKYGREMWTGQGPVVSLGGANLFSYYVDTTPGSSGSGVWGTWDGLDGYHVVGIHVTGSRLGNSASRITAAKFNRLVSWLNDN
jgi:V8-like Glu-specific endopeptidase